MARKKEILEGIEEGQVTVADNPPDNTHGANEFGEDYTMEVLSDNEPGADIFRVPFKDPNFEYRFLRDTKENMGVKTSNLLLAKGGWQVVPFRHLTEVNKIDKKNLQPDKSYKVGELVLAFMPKVLFEKKMKKDRENREDAMKTVQRNLDGETRINVPGVKGIGKGKLEKKRPLDFGSHNSVEDE